MKKHLCLVGVVLVCSLGLAGGTGEKNTAPAIPPDKILPSTPARTPGLEAAHALSTITGVAISPLLGVSSIGCWKYWKTGPEKRATLPWFAQPWFWVPALLLVGMVFVKDVSGTAIPTAIKKPFDVAEVFENKVSALLVAGLFVPLIASIFGSNSSDSSFFTEMGLATIDPFSLLNLVTVPLALVAFFVVWLVAHVINVLILISPFGTVDAVLKSARLFLLSTVAATSMAHPYAGALLSLLIIIVCGCLSGWAMRLMVFGNVFAWDLFTLRHKRSKPDPAVNTAFTARRLNKVPVRTYGKLVRDESGRLILKYRPWLVLPERTLTLPAAIYAVGRGLLNPDVVPVEDEWTKSVLTLPPRYLTHEEEVARIYQLAGVRDVGMIKGFKACWQWLRGRFIPARQRAL
jgi:hypothetical protein